MSLTRNKRSNGHSSATHESSKEKERRRSPSAKLAASLGRQLSPSKSFSPIRKNRKLHGNGSINEYSARRDRSRSSHRHDTYSPPISFPRETYHSSSYRPSLAPPFRSRATFLRSGRPPFFSSRFRGRPPRISYHSRPDISPPRPSRPSRSRSPIRKEERSPRSPQAYHHRSLSRSPGRLSTSPHWPRGGERGRNLVRGGRLSRRVAIIGNFGRPIYHKPDYEVSPDRTAKEDAPQSIQEVAEDRDELFTKMMEAKRREKLDEYYRLRDLLNSFDRRNPHLAYRGSGRSKRRRSSSPARSTNETNLLSREKKIRKNNDDGGQAKMDELEEVDCSDSGHEQNELEIEATKNLQNIIKEEGQVSEQKDSIGKAKKHIVGPKDEKDGQKVPTIQKAKNVNDNTQENKECQDNDDEFEEESIEDEQPGYDELDYDDDEKQIDDPNGKDRNWQEEEEKTYCDEEELDENVVMNALGNCTKEFLQTFKHSLREGLKIAIDHLEQSSKRAREKLPNSSNTEKMNSTSRMKHAKKNGNPQNKKMAETKEPSLHEGISSPLSTGQKPPSLLELALTKIVAQTSIPILSDKIHF